ncbi:hypothetical protein [Nostoc sp.]|uniref:hypothetical protein n=1 Tax=Nostoc sp. TaxID=1180 RepID=UPI002FF470D1
MNATCFSFGASLSRMGEGETKANNGGNLPPGSPVAYGGKPAYSAGLTARQWLPTTTSADIVAFNV